MKMHVVAMGQDKYWLRSVQNALSNKLDNVEIVEFSGDLQKRVDNLATPDSITLLLLDLSGIKDGDQVIGKIREKGWEYVVAVAVDPSAKEATVILRRNLGYDYWGKTYSESDIKKKVLLCFEEILIDLPKLRTKRENP